MAKVVEIRILKISETEEFGSTPPYVRLTSISSGTVLNTSISRKAKGANRFMFDEEDPSNLLSFQFAHHDDHAEFIVNLFSNDGESNQLMCYPGIGRIAIEIDSEVPSMEHMTCPLCEDNDPELEIGKVSFEFKVFFTENAKREPVVSDTAQHIEDGDIFDEDAMERMMSSSGFLPSEVGLDDEEEKEPELDFNATTGQIPNPKAESPAAKSLHATAPVGTKRPEAKKGALKPSKTTDGPSHSDHHVENAKKHKTLTEETAKKADKTDNKRTRPASARPQSAAPVATVAAAQPAAAAPTGAAIAKATATSMLQAMKDPNTNANQPLYEIIKNDLTKQQDASQYNKIVVRVHSVTLCSNSTLRSENGAEGSKKATLNIAIAPLPNRITTFRSVQANTHFTGSRQQTTYSFGLKTAALTMSLGDLRSKVFKCGQAPRLMFEVTSGDTVFTAESSLYLPALLRMHSGERICVPLQDASGGPQLQGSSIMFELNPPTASGGDGSTVVNYRSYYGSCTVSLNVLGVTGTDLKAYPDFKTQACLTSILPCSSHNTDGGDLVRFVGSTGFNNTLYTLNHSFQLTSQWPAVEMVEFKLALGNFSDDELGRVYIPVAAVVSLSAKHPEYNQVPLVFNAYKRDGDTFVLCKWQVVCSVSCSNLTEASEVISESVSNAATNGGTAGGPVDDFGLDEVMIKTSASPDMMMIDTSPSPVKASMTTAGPSNAQGGWLTSPPGGVSSANASVTGLQRTGVGASSATGVLAKMSNANPVKSISGQLACCYAGMFIRRLDPSSSSGGSVFQSLTNSDMLSVEATLMPEGTVRKTQSAPIAVSAITGNDILSTVDWVSDSANGAVKGSGRTIVLDVAWALQQRQISCIRVNVLLASKRNPSGVVGTAVIDLTSIIVNGSNGSQTFSPCCLVPVRVCNPHLGSTAGYGHDLCTSLVDDGEIAGWILMSCQFNATQPSNPQSVPSSSSASMSASVAALEERTKATFLRFKSYPSQYFMGLCGSDMRLLNGINCVTPVAIQSNSQSKVEAVNVHIALSALVISSNITLLQDNNPNSVLFLCLKSSNNLNPRLDGGDPVISSASLVNNALVWSSSDAVISLAVEESLNSFFYFYLVSRESYRNTAATGRTTASTNQLSTAMLTSIGTESRNPASPLMTNNMTSAVGTASGAVTAGTGVTNNVVAECNLLLNNGTLKKGVPFNVTLPFRDNMGLRLATVSMGVQLTSTTATNRAVAESVEDIYGRTSSPQFDLTSNIYTNTINTMDALAAVADKGKLHIDFIEGNIIDSTVWKSNTQPYFECTVVHTANANRFNTGNNLGISQSRTPFFSLSSSGDAEATENLLQTLKSQNRTTDWNVSCELSLPQEDYSVRTDNAKNIGGYTLHIVCRDCSKYTSPVIGTARIAIPAAMINKGVSVEQFITLTPPSTLVSAAVVGVRTAYSRVRIRITPIAPVVENGVAEVGGLGMGAVFYKLLGVSESSSDSSGVLDAVVTGTLKCNAVDPNDNNDETAGGLKKENTIYSSNAGTMVFNHEWGVFDDNRVLSGHLTIPGGFSEIALSVRPYNSTTPMTAAVPTLSTLTKLPSAPVGGAPESVPLPPLPVFELSLTKMLTGKGGSKSASSIASHASNRAVPRLMMEAVFVPYVVGRLVIECSDVKLFDNTSVAGMDNTKRKIVMRYVLASAKRYFNYSAVSVVGGETTRSGGASVAGSRTGIRGIKRGVVSSSSSVAVDEVRSTTTVLNVNTFEILGHADSKLGNGMTCMLPLFVSAFEVDPPVINGSAAEGGSQPCIGIGHVPTAALYYQAMRMAASSSLHSSGSTENKIEIGESPVLTTTLRLYHPETKASCGSASLKLKFIAESIPEDVMHQVTKALAAATTDAGAGGCDSARVELGLKQSFLVADEDKSGSVSAAELLKVIKNADLRKTKRSLTSTISPVIGLENATSLLLSLLPPSARTENLENLTDNELLGLVSSIFNRLDVDGDGLVSWWEWKAVLTASMCSAPSGSRSITDVNPMDTIVIGVTAANDALHAQAASSARDASARNTVGVYPFYPISGAAVTATSNVYTNTNPNSSITVSNPLANSATQDLMDNIGVPIGDDDYSNSDSRTVARLHNTINSLRMTNNILAKRFERAIISAQKMSISLEAYAAKGHAGGPEITAQDVLRLEERIRQVESENNANLQAFLNAKNRGDILANQLMELKSSTDFSTMANLDNMNKNLENNKKLKNEIQSHKDRLNAQRAQRKAMMRATVVIHQWLKKVVVPYMINRRRTKRGTFLAHQIKSHVVKKNYKLKRKAELRVISLIQRCVRGMLDRKRVRKMNEDAKKLQAAFRGKQDRDKVREMKRRIAEQEAAAMFSKQYRAQGIIRRAILRWLLFRHNKKEAAARRIQEAERKRKERKDMTDRRDKERKIREEEKRRQEESLRQNQAAITIQLANRERLKRKDGKQMTAAQRIIRKFKSDRAAMVLVDKKPEALEHAVSHFWVDFTQADSPSKKETSVNLSAAANARPEKNDHIGRVESVNEVDRIMTVRYLIPCAPSPASQGLNEKFITKSIPFDHPQIKWYTTFVELPPEPEPTHYHNRVIYNRATKPKIPNRPAHIEAALGYRVEIPSKEDFSEPGDMFTGKVVRVNPEKNRITVGFETVIPHSEDLDDYSFDDKSIVWVVKAPVERPDYLELCLGFGVEIMSKDDDRIEGDYFVGKIVAIDAAEQNVSISYQLNPLEGQVLPAASGNKSNLRIDTSNSDEKVVQEADIEVYNWMNTDIHWVVAPIFDRPATLHDALGYRVEIKSREENAHIGDVFKGKVVGYHQPRNEIIVQFDSDAVEEDRENVPFKSPDVTWVCPPLTAPVISTRPLNIADSVGYLVEVKSSEPDAEPGDMFTGRVVSYSNIRESITIRFDTYTEEDEEDKEEFQFNNEDILWLHNPKQSRSKFRPVVEETLGHIVEVVQENLPPGAPRILGEVIGFNPLTRALQIRFDEDIVETIHYTSSDLLWRCPIVMINPKSGGRVAVKSHTPKHVVSPRGPKPASTRTSAVVAAVTSAGAGSAAEVPAVATATPRKSNLVDPLNKVHTPHKKASFSTAPDSQFIISNDSSNSLSQAPQALESRKLKMIISSIDIEDLSWSSDVGSLHPGVSFRFGSKECRTRRQQTGNGSLTFSDVLELEVDPEDFDNHLELITKVVMLSPNDTVSAVVATSQRRLNAILSDLNKEKKITLNLRPVNVNDHGGEINFVARIEKASGASHAESAATGAKNSTPFVEAKEPATPLADVKVNASVTTAVAEAKAASTSSSKRSTSPRNLEVKTNDFVPVSMVKEPASPLKSLSRSNSGGSSFTVDPNRPAPEHVEGYHIVITEKGSDDLHCKVVGYNEQEAQLLCRIYSPTGVLDTEIEELPYSMPGVRWYKEKPSWAPGGHK